MKKIRVILVLAMLFVLLSSQAIALHDTWKILPVSGSGTWKKAPRNYTMPDSGSYWKATYTRDNGYTTSQAYLYRSGQYRATHIEDFPDGNTRTGLEYLSGRKVVGSIYWIVASSPYGTTVEYDYYF